MKNPVILLLIFVFVYNHLSAQTVKAIIVQLNTDQNQVRYLQRTGNTKEAESISNEATIASKKMISDFSDNFSYCPVYYFIDTNTDLIRNKQFDNVLLNADGTPVKKIILNPSDSNYLTVRYGYSDAASAVSTCQGITVSTDKFEKVFFFPSCDKQKSDKKYLFISRKYDIKYFGSAAALNTEIKKKYDESR